MQPYAQWTIEIDIVGIQVCNPLISSARTVHACGLDHAQEVQDLFRGQVFKDQPRNRSSARGRDMHEEELQRVPIASNGAWPEPFLGFEIILEKREDSLTNTVHCIPPFGAMTWKR